MEKYICSELPSSDTKVQWLKVVKPIKWYNRKEIFTDTLHIPVGSITWVDDFRKNSHVCKIEVNRYGGNFDWDCFEEIDVPRISSSRSIVPEDQESLDALLLIHHNMGLKWNSGDSLISCINDCKYIKNRGYHLYYSGGVYHSNDPKDFIHFNLNNHGTSDAVQNPPRKDSGADKQGRVIIQSRRSRTTISCGYIKHQEISFKSKKRATIGKG